MDYTQRLRDLRADHDEPGGHCRRDWHRSEARWYSRYETGINELPLRYLVKLCQVYQSVRTIFWACPGALSWPADAGMLIQGRPLLRGRAGWLFMPAGIQKGEHLRPFWVQYLN